ncbi:MAG: aldehyde dehydrogenase family protein, partial [Myxococcota bacterium]|nr:aldehyde dehydrogenase family protein [Myxococcota bacterium]
MRPVAFSGQPTGLSAGTHRAMLSAMVFGNYIGGQWVGAKSGATFERRNPADTRDRVGLFVESRATDVDDAVRAARGALPGWRRLTPDARAQFFFKAAYRLLARKEEIAAALTREEGKSLAEA